MASLVQRLKSKASFLKKHNKFPETQELLLRARMELLARKITIGKLNQKIRELEKDKGPSHGI